MNIELKCFNPTPLSSDEQTKNRLLHLWSKFYYEMRYEVALEHSLLYIHFYSILEEKME